MYVVPNVHPWNVSYWRINDVFKTGYSHIKNYLPKSTYKVNWGFNEYNTQRELRHSSVCLKKTIM